MEKWQQALNKFLERYIHEDWFVGAFLCGSYATGNQTKFSDIDVNILAKNDLDWQEKSNCYVDGYLIEYCINPIWKFEEYMESSLKDHTHINQNQVIYGEVLFDDFGEIKKLRAKALKQIKKPFISVPDDTVNYTKYGLWDKYDELKSLDKQGLHIDMQYWRLVDSLLTFYYDVKNLPHVPHSKIEKILTDQDFAKRYHIEKMPSAKFVNLLMGCFNAKSKKDKLTALDVFYNFVIKEAGGFDIGKFVCRRALHP